MKLAIENTFKIVRHIKVPKQKTLGHCVGKSDLQVSRKKKKRKKKSDLLGPNPKKKKKKHTHTPFSRLKISFYQIRNDKEIFDGHS